MKKMLPKLWRAPLPLKIKIEGTMHLTSNLGYLLLFTLCLVFRSSAYAGAHVVSGGNELTKLFLVDIPLFLAASLSVTAFYVCAQIELHAQWWKRLLYLPLMMAVGVGLSLNNARAVLEALFNHESEFIRTPKSGTRPRGALRGHNPYRPLRGLIPFFEIAFGLYFSYVMFDALYRAQWLSAVFILVFQVGFLYVGVMSLVHASGWFRRSTPVLAPASA